MVVVESRRLDVSGVLMTAGPRGLLVSSLCWNPERSRF